MLLQFGREALHRDLLRGRQHQRGAGRDLADFAATGGHDRDAVDAGSAGLDEEVELLLLVVAHVLGHHLADIVVGSEPAELEIHGLRLGLGEAARWQEICSGGSGGSSSSEQCAAAHFWSSPIVWPVIAKIECSKTRTKSRLPSRFPWHRLFASSRSTLPSGRSLPGSSSPRSTRPPGRPCTTPG